MGHTVLPNFTISVILFVVSRQFIFNVNIDMIWFKTTILVSLLVILLLFPHFLLSFAFIEWFLLFNFISAIIFLAALFCFIFVSCLGIWNMYFSLIKVHLQMILYNFTCCATNVRFHFFPMSFVLLVYITFLLLLQTLQYNFTIFYYSQLLISFK